MSKKNLLISIISHGQGQLIKNLFKCLNNINFPEFLNVHVHLILNIPEDEDFIDNLNLNLVVLRNSFKKGFGANNNEAFRSMHSDYFLVINPDIQILDFNFTKFLHSFNKSDISVMSPVVKDSYGNIQDNFRTFPTIASIIRRRLGKKQIISLPDEKLYQTDWVAGMFMLFKSLDFNSVNGFDEKFFMYLEDADICRRLSYKKKKVILNKDFEVIHNAQHRSRKNLRHFLWHLNSLIKFVVSK